MREKITISVFLATIIMAIAVIISGCNNEKSTGEQPDEATLTTEQVLLISELEKLNMELFNSDEFLLRAGTRKPGWFLKFLTVASADILGGALGAVAGGVLGGIGSAANPVGIVGGAIGGALICGTGASMWAGRILAFESQQEGHISAGYALIGDPNNVLSATVSVTKEELTEVASMSNVKIAIPEEFAAAAEVGVAHNAVINRLFSGDFASIDLDSATEEQLLWYEVVNHPDYIAAYNQTLAGVDAAMREIDNLDIDALINGTADMSLLSPAVKQVMTLFLQLYVEYPDKVEDTDFIINKYIEKIEASNALSDEEKVAVYSGLSIAAYSPRYWQEFGIE